MNDERPPDAQESQVDPVAKITDHFETNQDDGLPEKPEAPPPTKRSFIYALIATSLLALLALGSILFSQCSSSEVPTKVHRVAIDRTWYPLELGIKDKNMSAFIETVVSMVAANENLKVYVIPVPQRALFQGLESGRYEGMLSLLTPQQTYAFKFIFSTPLYHLGPVLVINKGDPYRSLEDLKGRNVGVMSSVKSHIDYDIDPTMRFLNYKSIPQAFSHLESRKIDALIINSLPAHTYLQGLYAGKFEVAAPPLTDEGIRLILQDSSPEAKKFLELFNKGLKDLRNKGTYNALIQKWDLVNTEWQKR